ncbi:YqaE/Pmp3 family membrane protein [Calycomorphotria hydatis]|uniref:Proteolipid membrane potential modulator n=1 Tax=Calycomorphotria hydatis TaxID=2528027 RepID=A0A517T636_9PLAN|nr:Proteolipid membrane potential modulator [Calycomorphotria hydatis]
MAIAKPTDSTLGDFIKVLFSILLPPVGVFFEVGFGLHFWLNIVLTLLGYFPGVIHAVYIIAKK